MKEAIWLACKPKNCCFTAIVVPSGRDVFRVSRALDAPPWTFLKYFPSKTERPDGFRFERGGSTFRLALAKGASRRVKAPAPCIFLLKSRPGDHRCGLGALRPLACQSFPSEVVDGVLCVRNDGGCTCRTWSLADVDLADETRIVNDRQSEAQEYHQVVARWNTLVDESSTPQDFLSYCDFLLQAYDELSGIRPPAAAISS